MLKFDRHKTIAYCTAKKDILNRLRNDLNRWLSFRVPNHDQRFKISMVSQNVATPLHSSSCTQDSLHKKNSTNSIRPSATLLILPASPHENDSVTTTEESIQRPANPPIYVKLLEENSDWRATGIIHDFNNQLAIILSHCSIALTKLPLDSKARANLERSVRATKRAAELSSQLHVGRAAQSDNFTQIDFNNLVRETVEDLEPQLTAHAIVEQHYASDLPPISAYCLLLQRALFNILSNAAEAMHGQAGKIAITTREVVVTNDEYVKAPRQLPPGTYVLWEVSDTGQGMTQDTLDHIFEPYYSTKSIGAGLGLTIVQHIAQLHHSTIYIRSKAKEGTTFQLFIPVNADSTLTH